MNTTNPSFRESAFGTVPKHDYLGLFKDGRTKYERVVDLLHFRKEDVAVATGVTKNSVRYDDRIKQELEDHLRQWAVALALVADHFKDAEKTILWFQIPNPLLGDLSPRDMIRTGRFRKLLKFIQTALDENKR